MKLSLAGFLFFLAFVSQAAGELIIDGNLDDWDGFVRVIPADPSPLLGIAAQASGGRVAFCLGLAAPVSLQRNNEISLVLDTDSDPATGRRLGSLGAEVVWRFGERTGEIIQAGRTEPVDAYDLGMVTGPTMEGKTFEVSIDTDLAALYPLMSAPALNWGLLIGGKVEAMGTLDVCSEPDPASGSGPPPPGEAVRVLSYNVLRNGISRCPERYDRLLRALDPDIIGLQEVYGPDPAELANRFGKLLGGTWSVAVHSDLVVASRYPLIRSRPVLGNLAVVIDLAGTPLGGQLRLLNLHLPSAGRDRERQWEADSLIAFLRDSGGGEPFASPSSPLLILGDFNLVGDPGQLTTLTRGEIANRDRFGKNYPPDSDGTPLADLVPHHSSAPEVYTWWASEGRAPYYPGRLDFFLYSDSNLNPTGFVLRTESLAEEELRRLGLERLDTSLSSDHLPLVADLLPVSSGETTSR